MQNNQNVSYIVYFNVDGVEFLALIIKVPTTL